MRRTRDIDLMLLADGELDADARAELEAALADDPAAQAKLEALDHLGEAVRGSLELAADDAEPRLARMWEEIDKRIELDARADEAVPAAAAVAAPPPRGVWSRVSRWLDSYRGHVLTGALSAGAVAAIALVMRPDPKVPSGIDAPAAPVIADTGQPDGANGAGTGGTAPDRPGPDRIAGNPTGEPIDALPAGSPPEIETLEVTGGSGSVITYEGADGEQTTVVWVTPDDTLEGI